MYLCIFVGFLLSWHRHTMINRTFDVSQHSLDCSEMTFLGFLHEPAQQSDTLTNIWLGITKIPQISNDLFVQYYTYKLIICIISKLCSCLLWRGSFIIVGHLEPFQNILSVRFLVQEHSFICVFKSIPMKYDNFPWSNISNSCINFYLNLLVSNSSEPIINKSSTYKYKIIRLTMSSLLTYTSCSKIHFVKPVLTRKLFILLFQATGACFKSYRAFLNLYTFESYPLILNPSGWVT